MKKHGGQNKYAPTPADRETVKSMAACGFAHEAIARCIGVKGIDDKTLRKHFRRELDTAMAKANATVANKAYQMAIAGNPPAATIFWLKCRANWKETQAFEHGRRPPDITTLKGLRDRAILAVLFGCGLRRSEVAALTHAHIQQRDDRWCIVDMVGKHGRVRTVPMPTWVKVAIDAWSTAAGIADGYVFRPVNRADRVAGDRLGEKVVWQMLRQYAEATGVPGIAPHDARRTCAKLCRAAGGELEQIQLLLGHASVQTTERYLGTKQDLVHAPNDGIKLRVSV
jgi:integrase